MKEMAKFDKLVSVIIPVYNSEKTLGYCMESILNQTIDKKKLEVLLIDDGSEDNSFYICKCYSRIYDYIKTFTIKNGGVSKARNYGISKSTGKFLMFLDADDKLTEDTIEKVSCFFERNMDKTDIVTYKIVPYKNNKALTLHYRYKYLKETKIYDVNEFPYINQTSMNVVVKNNKEIYFDTTLSQGEDQKYITEHVLKKNKIGFCCDGEYQYIRDDSSSSSLEAYSYILFEQRMKLWEELFFRYETDKIPAYLQSQLLANYAWEILSDCVFPYHYTGQKKKEAKERWINIINCLDIDVILNHPTLDFFHKHFLISMKTNANVFLMADLDKIFVYSGTKLIHSAKDFEIVVGGIHKDNEKIIIRGFIKSVIFNYTDEKPVLIANERSQEREIPIFKSISSCYKTKMETNNFYGFIYECNPLKNTSFSFKVSFQGISYDVRYYFLPPSVFKTNIGLNSFILKDTQISYDIDTKEFLLKKLLPIEKEYVEQLIPYNREPYPLQVRNLRKEAVEYRDKHEVWIYCDNDLLKCDNAYLQFQHDYYKEDGVERYFIISDDFAAYSKYFKKDQLSNLVVADSDIHKLLYLSARYVITSFSDIKPRNPFNGDSEYSLYRDIFDGDVIYLQHGVCHADLRWLQSAERCKADKIVISSHFEEEIFVNEYRYRKEDLIPAGMPKFDIIDKNRKPKRRILYAPSWRSYLLGRGSSAVWQGDEKRLLSSDYYIKNIEFLNSSSLKDFLERNDLELDAKLHQNMMSVLSYFEISNERVNLIPEDVTLEDYLVFITDISSFAFYYAYLCRPIIYFMPDMDQFLSGMNHYRKLFLPFDKGFGNLVLEAEDVVNELKHLANNKFIADTKYEKRMNEFYLDFDNCRDNIYEYLFSKR